MHITIIMVLTYILCCVRIATAPWRYWQLNAHYFSKEQGVFSKMSIDELIPDRWRLAQAFDSETYTPDQFPVFLKPEWGQNAHGIHRADDLAQLVKLRANLECQPQRYLVQQAAPGQREFELFSIDEDREDGKHDVFTVTEAINNSEIYPINSKYNRSTRYSDITGEFDAEQRVAMSGYLSQIGKFGISRMAVRAESTEALVNGDFHIIEINLFLPMPINLLDGDYTWQQKWAFIQPAMMSLAKSTKLIKPVEKRQPIFMRMMMYGRDKPNTEKCATNNNQGTKSHKIGEQSSQS